ncbi:DUF2264 domain-containing protein [Streptomyces pathocidini]|uniref:DUF2264 domain-containing protein n=1 Tax=Streptomyces pathocidini TaxID=1650571 RepID=A0ABW7UV57_9ACTN|nr:DUF2264 domain-containing protein [Streptomyces pathocidini]
MARSDGATPEVAAASPSRLPFPGNALRTRADFQRALLQLVAPWEARLDGDWSVPGTTYGSDAAGLEGFARPLWGLAALAAGGGAYEGWPRIRRMLVRGTDPADTAYWGAPGDMDQRLVEAAAIGFALALAPGELWEPLTPKERWQLADWLRTAAAARSMPDNNWRLFAVLMNLGLQRVGEPYNQAVTAAAFERIEAFHRGGGWYSDGTEGQACDYYGPWALHFYALLHTALAHDPDPAVAARVRSRAERFAAEFRHWFADDGAALPLGRSLTYRFAQAAFWGALAYAEVPALPWGQVRGLWARHLRWWARQPVLDGDGALSVGYGYPNLLMSEQYNAPGSPYWACKAFLPLALPADHPFWTAEEEAAAPLPEPHAQPVAGLLLQRDAAGQVTALAAAPHSTYARHSEAKYAKFAYSTAFGFSVPSRGRTLEGAGADSALAVSEDGVHWRVREEHEETAVDERSVRATWRPFPDVVIDTTLIPAGPWHLRVHHIRTGRRLFTAEGGYCVPREPGGAVEAAPGMALVRGGGLVSGVRDLADGGGTGEGVRPGQVVLPDPNTHLLWPRTALPVLTAELAPGEHRLASGVFGARAEAPADWAVDWETAPTLS